MIKVVHKMINVAGKLDAIIRSIWDELGVNTGKIRLDLDKVPRTAKA